MFPIHTRFAAGASGQHSRFTSSGLSKNRDLHRSKRLRSVTGSMTAAASDNGIAEPQGQTMVMLSRLAIAALAPGASGRYRHQMPAAAAPAPSSARASIARSRAAWATIAGIIDPVPPVAPIQRDARPPAFAPDPAAGVPGTSQNHPDPKSCPLPETPELEFSQKIGDGCAVARDPTGLISARAPV